MQPRHSEHRYNIQPKKPYQSITYHTAKSTFFFCVSPRSQKKKRKKKSPTPFPLVRQKYCITDWSSPFSHSYTYLPTQGGLLLYTQERISFCLKMMYHVADCMGSSKAIRSEPVPCGRSEILFVYMFLHYHFSIPLLFCLVSYFLILSLFLSLGMQWIMR